MVAASVLPLKHYAEFSGRSTRTEVVGFYILTTIIALVANLVAACLGQDAARPWLEAGLAAIFLVPQFALSVRRLHDSRRSGWWMLLIAPFLAAVIWEFTFHPPHPFTLHLQSHLPWWVMAPVVLSMLALWALLLWPDDLYENRHGSNPRCGPVGEPA